MRVDDATLIERARQGSAEALSTFYRRYWPLAWQWAYGIAGRRSRVSDDLERQLRDVPGAFRSRTKS